MSVHRLLAEARDLLPARAVPADLEHIVRAGGLVVDIRPLRQRRCDRSMPNALVIDRNVLEWRLDPDGPDRIPELTGAGQPVVVVCDEGYASSLAAASLQRLGLWRATDLAGGYQAWRRWERGRRAGTSPLRPDHVDALPV
jgi:rhodanese-related sulfurtransferase